MVRLKVLSFLFLFRHSLRFNSTMVRLKVCKLIIEADHLLTFQFHNGSIKRNPPSNPMPQSQIGFNSTMVRLKVSPDKVPIPSQKSFNSTMVRLKGISHRTPLIKKNMFQFHNGSIKSVARLASLATSCHVSIPQWFD